MWWKHRGTCVEKLLNEVSRNTHPIISFAQLFRVILDDTGIRPSTFAIELNRERSLMYKWRSGSSVPPAYYYPKIISIISEQISEARKAVLETHLRSLIDKLDLSPELRRKVLSARTLEALLFECLHLSTMTVIDTPYEHSIEGNTHFFLLATTGALFAATAGGMLWNILNRVLSWPYYMGSEEGITGIIPAFVWGVTTLTPIPTSLLLLQKKEERNFLIIPSVLLVLVGCVSAVVFHGLDIRDKIGSFVADYEVQELLTILVYSILVAAAPLLATVLTDTRLRLKSPKLHMIFLPTAASILCVSFTFLIKRPFTELIQLRGFLVGFSLRLCMFLVLLLMHQSTIDEARRSSVYNA